MGRLGPPGPSPHSVLEAQRESSASAPRSLAVLRAGGRGEAAARFAPNSTVRRYT